MRKLAVALLAFFRRVSLFWLRLRGKTEEDQAAERVVSGKSWDEFCDTLKAAGAALNFPGAPRDAFSQAEGYRYLTRLTRAGLAAFVEYADPKAPFIHRVAHETVKLGADNPDNYYQTAAISGELEYCIRGQRNTVTYLAFGTQAGNYGQGSGLPTTGYLEAGELELNEDGSFEVFLSTERKEKNWLPMSPESGTLVVRQTFLDREKEVPAELHIECTSARDAGDRASPVTAKQLDDGLKSVGMMVAGASLLFAKWAKDFKQHSNQLPRFDPDVSLAAGGDPNIAYYHSHWALGEDEALVIEVMPPECEYWNFQLNNYWMESLDYRYHRIHTNKHLADYEPDGSVRIIVAHTDPKMPNWLETTGHFEGTMCFRWVRSEETPQPNTRVVRFAELNELTES